MSLILVDPARAADPPLSLEAYWQKVEQTQSLLAELEAVSPEARRAQLLKLADQWAGVEAVALPDESMVVVDHSFLAGHLRADPVDLDRLQDFLTALLAARRAWPSSQHTPADLDRLESILARPEFQWQPQEPSLLATLWRRLLGYLWERLLPYLPDEAVISLNSSFFNFVLTGLGGLALALVLAFILRELLAHFVSEAELEAGAGAGDELLTADTAFKRAQGLSNEGDYRTAVRYLYLSTLLLLDERGLLRYNRSQTNREYLRSVAHLPHLAAILQEVIDVFDRVWYGYQTLDEAAYARYAARVAELRQHRLRQ